MSKLLYAGVRRYIKSAVFWLALAATVIIAVLSGYQARQLSLDDLFIIAEFIVMAVLITWVVGREYDEGIFRNKLVSGHTKGTVFMSELILGTGACVLLFLIFAVIFAIFNGYIFSVVPANVLIRVFINFLLVNIGIAAILITISCLIPHRAIIAIVNILLVIGMMFVSYGLDDALRQPEYYTEYAHEYTEVTDEDGTVHMEESVIPGTERKIKNDSYLDGWRRTVAQTICDILPTGHVIDDMGLLNIYFGYDYYNNYPQLGLTYETSESSKFSMTEEEDHMLNVNLIYAPAFILAVSLTGYAIFCRKDFK